MPKIKKADMPSVVKDVKQLRNLNTAVMRVIGINSLKYYLAISTQLSECVLNDSVVLV